MKRLAVLILLIACWQAAGAQEPVPAAPGVLDPPGNVEAMDTPNDEGQAVNVSWERSPQDVGDPAAFKGYRIERAPDQGGPWTEAGFVIGGKTEFQDTGVRPGQAYFYRVASVAPDGREAWSPSVGPTVSRAQWFNTSRVNVLVLTALICFLIIWYIERAKKGEQLYIRKIQGLDAIDDAVGRATEMGKPILYSFGLGEIRDIVTVASLAILRQVAVRCAEHGTELLVPNWDPIVMAAAQETVQQAYAEPGRPDLYKEGNISFLTTDQFGYAAGVDGMIVRQKPGAIFFLGYFYAEALIMSETGHSVGAIQIAGTTAITQLPFFIASCDYTLIGEEMLAASCYIKRDPQLLGSLKGEDLFKAVLIIGFAAMALAGTLSLVLDKAGSHGLWGLFQAIQNWFTTV